MTTHQLKTERSVY